MCLCFSDQRICCRIFSSAYKNALADLLIEIFPSSDSTNTIETEAIEAGELTIKESGNNNSRLLPAGIFARWSR
jgi:hypothetical protein